MVRLSLRSARPTFGSFDTATRRAPKLRVCAVAALLLFGACRGSDLDTMIVVETMELPDSGAMSLHVEPDSTFLVGYRGEVHGLDRTGKLLMRHAGGGNAIPTVAGRRGERLFLRSRDSIGSFTPGTPLLTRPGPSTGNLLVDPGGRFLLGTREHGDILAWDAETLDPIWGWAELGATSTAIAISRAGHRVYQAVDRTGDSNSPQMLVRDTQTGRVLRSLAVPFAARSIVMGNADQAYLAGRSATGGTIVMSMGWRGGEMEVAWRKSLERLEIPEEGVLKLLLSPDGTRLLVAVVGGESGLYLLEAATGEIVGRMRDAGRDLTFAPDGGVLLLFSGEIRRVGAISDRRRPRSP